MQCMQLPGATLAITLLGTEHLSVLAIATAGIAGLIGFTRRVRGTRLETPIRRVVCYALAAVLVVCAVFYQVRALTGASWTVQESLPLHLCDFAVIVTVIAVVAAAGRGRAGVFERIPAGGFRQRAYELSYYWGLAGTSQALLTPDLQAHFPDPEYLRFFLAHGSIVAGVLLMTLGLGMRPRPDSPRFAWLVTAGLAICVLVLNRLLGSNYMYLNRPPASPTLIDYLGPWPWSLLGLAAVGTAAIGLCYAPWWLADRVRSRVQKARGGRFEMRS